VTESRARAASAEGPDERVVDGVLTEEMGDEIGERLIEGLRRLRQVEEKRYRAEHPEEGLRERKRRLTRQLISDAATVIFASRGFDNVKVSEIADRVNVSMKTLYNYFPTKESLVLDDADELVARLTAALRDRPAGLPIIETVVAALRAGLDGLTDFDDEFAYFYLRFEALINETPSLRAHWLGILDRFARAAAEEVAHREGGCPTDPVPTAAGWALAGLVQVDSQSRIHHIRAGRRGRELREAIVGDVQRAARLLAAGLT
jgi:AcrR family transcriptional regulator